MAKRAAESVLRASALNLPVDDRRDVIAIGSRLRSALQRDIIGDLPLEISCQILAHLELEDILRCNLVSKRWGSICNEQRLWSLLCLRHSPPIRPRAASRADLLLRQRLLKQAKHRDDPPADDEAEFDAIWEGADLETPVTPASGRRSGRIDGIHGLDVFGDVRGFRDTVWERSGTGSATHIQASNSRRGVTARLRNFFDGAEPIEDESIALSSGRHQMLPSYMVTYPAPNVPTVNYKHLFIVHRLLNQRLRQEGPGLNQQQPDNGNFASSRTPQVAHLRPRVYDPISSVEAGGLAGHDCTIYTLQLVNRLMTMNMPRLRSSAECGPDTGRNTPFPVPTLDLTGGANPTGCANPTRHSQTVSSRDWLVTGSRDHTIRLWDISGPQPMVVKIFHSGHTGSVLAVHAVEIPRHPGDPAAPASERDHTRLVIVSGGADGRICLWDVENGDGLPEIVREAHSNSVLCVRADAERVVSCSKDLTIRVFDTRTLQELNIIGEATDPAQPRPIANAIGLSSDYIISVSNDKAIRVWDVRTGALLAGLQCSCRNITSVDFQPVNRHDTAQTSPRSGSALKGTIVIGSADATITILHLVSVSHSAVHIVEALDMVPPTRDMTFSEMMTDEDSVSIEPVPPAREEGSDPVEQDQELRIEPQRVCWASCVCPPGRARPQGTTCWRCHTHVDLVRSVQLKDNVILSGGYDSTVKVWDRSTGKLLSDLPASQSGRIFAVAGDRLRIVCAGLSARLTVWDLTEGLDTTFVEP